MRTPLPKTNAALTETAFRALPYLLSWGALAAATIVGMHRMPLALYTPIDGEWAKWNVEAILHFGKVFDLSPYSMLAGMGSMYFPNLPWLNPGALALGLPFSDPTNNIISYAVYAAELAVSILVLARVIGFSWLMATAAAQLYLYLLFPPFSEVFRIYAWYSLAPYYAHLQAVLNGATALLLLCGRQRDWRRNAVLAAGFLALFISGLLSAPFTFVFAAPAYVAISAALILARGPRPSEWAWKIAALALCLMFFFGSGLLDYYLGTIATAGRTPTAAMAWDRLLSADAWLRLIRDHSLCGDPRLMLCIKDRGAWLQIAALCGAVLAIVTRRGDIRTAAWALIGYIGLVHVYAYAYQAGWLGPAAVLSSHFLMLSSWSFVCMFAVVPFFEPFRLMNETAAPGARDFGRRQVAGFLASLVVAALLVVIVVTMLRHPYDIQRYRPAQLLIAVGAFGAVVLAAALVQAYRDRRGGRPAFGLRDVGWRRAAALSAFPILALVHLSIGVDNQVATARDPSLRNYLQAQCIDRGGTTVSWLYHHHLGGQIRRVERRPQSSRPQRRRAVLLRPRLLSRPLRRNLHRNRLMAREHSDLRRIWRVDLGAGARLRPAAARARRHQRLIPTTCGHSRSMPTYCARSACVSSSPMPKRSNRRRRCARPFPRRAPPAFDCSSSPTPIWGPTARPAS